jgi:hypothetical protein
MNMTKPGDKMPKASTLKPTYKGNPVMEKGDLLREIQAIELRKQALGEEITSPGLDDKDAKKLERIVEELKSLSVRLDKAKQRFSFVVQKINRRAMPTFNDTASKLNTSNQRRNEQILEGAQRVKRQVHNPFGRKATRPTVIWTPPSAKEDQKKPAEEEEVVVRSAKENVPVISATANLPALDPIDVERAYEVLPKQVPLRIAAGAKIARPAAGKKLTVEEYQRMRMTETE